MTPLIIPVFLPHLGCRQHCLFCNQKATAKEIPSPDSVRKFVENSLSGFPPDQEKREKQIAFYGGSFTAMEREEQGSYLREVQPFLSSGGIDSIRLSTRPDALDEETLSLLKEYGVKTIEIGAQSMVDEVLLLSRRGHGTNDTASAISRLRDWGFEVGVHLMIGLPGDTCDRFLQTLDRLIDLKPDFIRIHPTLVLKGASLENLWKLGKYSPLTLNEAVDWLKRGVLQLERASIPIVRIGLQPTKELEEYLLAGPFHPALHQLVDSAIYYDMAEYLLRNYPNGSRPAFLCHPKEVSNLKGQRNENILKLKKHFKLSEVLINGRNDVPRGRLMLQTQEGEFSIHRKSLVFYPFRVETQ
ncbi:MAG: radical SAM protein [Thermodesulfobacteriota bacterium]|nr:radical SAM protein [Thermodesulfobacteriota bacterium]